MMLAYFCAHCIKNKPSASLGSIPAKFDINLDFLIRDTHTNKTAHIHVNRNIFSFAQFSRQHTYNNCNIRYQFRLYFFPSLLQ